MFRQFFRYSGSLYIATYSPYSKIHVALSLQSINSILHITKEEKSEISKHSIPLFDFKEFTRTRFGVFHGEVKKVILSINKESKRYFTNRTFHQSQVVFNENDKNEDMVIRWKYHLVQSLYLGF